MANPQLSTLPQLTEEIAINEMRSFFRDKPFIFFGTGMSCALDHRFGMPALKEELSRSVRPDSREPEQERQWSNVMQALQNGDGLESALDSVTNPALIQKVTVATGLYISSIDREHAFRIAKGETIWPATAFFKRLVDTLPEGDRILHALTPNYDTLFEHACDNVGIDYTSGFCGGIERRTDWDGANRSMLLPEKVSRHGRLKTVYKYRKHVRLFKVHGSLSFFFHRNTVVENNAWMWNAPEFSCRVMITPGLSKYQTLQHYRQELLKFADAAIERANHFLFLGYGFNDTHLEAYIRRKLVTQACKGLIVTRDSNPRIESLLAEADNLWLVCKLPGIDADGTRIFNKRYEDRFRLSSKSLWDISVFTTEILGG